MWCTFFIIHLLCRRVVHCIMFSQSKMWSSSWTCLITKLTWNRLFKTIIATADSDFLTWRCMLWCCLFKVLLHVNDEFLRCQKSSALPVCSGSHNFVCIYLVFTFRHTIELRRYLNWQLSESLSGFEEVKDLTWPEIVFFFRNSFWIFWIQYLEH